MAQVSVLMPFVPVRHEQVLPYAALVQWTSATRLWHGQTQLLDPHDSFTYATACGFRVPVGIGVTLFPFRHPMQAALQARSLAVATGHPLVVGYGPGERRLQEAMLGAAYASPLTVARQYVDAVRRLLMGEQVRVDGEWLRCDVSMMSVPHPGIEVGVGVLRPGMARVAGEVADVAITWLAPAEYIRTELLPPMQEAAAGSARPCPRVVAVVPMCLQVAGRDPVDVALAGSAPHLQGPHYRDMLQRAGLTLDPSDLAACGRELLEGGVFLTGEPADLATQVKAYFAAGVDEVVVNATGVHMSSGGAAALAEIEALVTAVAA
jgi:alkanesulfonate monooxygenase SsuD/methylene tetrahydromethanopterin reductase-like flavin-dependent oxidoreductase (luciferase family)